MVCTDTNDKNILAQRIVATPSRSEGMKRKQNGGKSVFCESKNVPKIKQEKLDLLNKKDLNKFLKSKEFKKSKIAEELIIEYVSSVKQSSPAKKMLLMNKEIFNKYIKNNSITTKEDVEKLFSISEANQNTIPNLFNKTEREVWYSTESFKKCGINKEEIEQLIEEEQEKVKNNTKTINIIKEYSKTKELEKRYNTNKEALQFSEPSTTKIARIETVTKAKSVDKVIEELKAKEIKNQDSSLIKNEATTVQQQTYIPAQIKADGKINRQILETVSGKEFVTERSNLMNVSKPLVGKGTNTINISEKVKQQVAKQINENKTSFVQDNTVINERIAVEASPNQDSVAQNILQTEPVEYSLETKKPKVYKKTEQTPEEIKMAKMNANYEHDKAVLAKEDPMFAKNKFWDVGHAEGSGELDRNSYNNMLNKVKEESLMKLDEKNDQK